MAETRITYQIWFENLRRRHYSKELGIDGRIKLHRILGN